MIEAPINGHQKGRNENLTFLCSLALKKVVDDINNFLVG